MKWSSVESAERKLILRGGTERAFLSLSSEPAFFRLLTEPAFFRLFTERDFFRGLYNYLPAFAVVKVADVLDGSDSGKACLT